MGSGGGAGAPETAVERTRGNTNGKEAQEKNEVWRAVKQVCYPRVWQFFPLASSFDAEEHRRLRRRVRERIFQLHPPWVRPSELPGTRWP